MGDGGWCPLFTVLLYGASSCSSSVQRVTPMLSNPLAAAFDAMLFQYVNQFAVGDGGVVPHDLERPRIVAVQVRRCPIPVGGAPEHPPTPLDPA